MSDRQQTDAPVETYRRLALHYEAERQFPRALFIWAVLDDLGWRNTEAKERIAHLKQTIRTESGKHFMQGKEYLAMNAFQEARKEFALTLSYNPFLEEAADHLRRLSVGDEFVEYEVRVGDSPERIAHTVYGDGGRHFLVTYFADTENDKEMRPGRLLRLPAPDQETRAKPVQPSKPYRPKNEAPKIYDKAGAETHYANGVAHYLEQQFQEAIREWEETLRLDPEHPNAKRDIQKARSMLRKTRSK